MKVGTCTMTTRRRYVGYELCSGHIMIWVRQVAIFFSVILMLHSCNIISKHSIIVIVG